MIRSCAWCGREFGCKPPLEIREVTHGICKACEERPRLVVRRKAWPLDGSGDDWVCPYCEEAYNADGVAQCWHRMIAEREDPPEWVTPLQAAQATGRSIKTIRDWTKPLTSGAVRVEVRTNETTGRQEVSWDDVRKTDDTAARRARSVA